MIKSKTIRVRHHKVKTNKKHKTNKNHKTNKKHSKKTSVKKYPEIILKKNKNKRGIYNQVFHKLFKEYQKFNFKFIFKFIFKLLLKFLITFKKLNIFKNFKIIQILILSQKLSKSSSILSSKKTSLFQRINT